MIKRTNSPRAFVGTLGALGELAHLLGKLVDVRRADISIEYTEATAQLNVGSRIRTAARAIYGQTGRPATLADGASRSRLEHRPRLARRAISTSICQAPASMSTSAAARDKWPVRVPPRRHP